MSSISPFLNQRGMTKAPPLERKNARASDSDVRSQTGSSGPVHVPHHHHHKFEKIGDHRQEGLHSDSRTSSKPPVVTAGKPYGGPMNGGNGNGIS
jgi:hypothetical protein